MIGASADICEINMLVVFCLTLSPVLSREIFWDESVETLELVCAGLFADEAGACPRHMQHRDRLFGPDFLGSHQICSVRKDQLEGEIMVTFPLGSHQGWNHGFAWNEAVNYGNDRWLPFGLRYERCGCNFR